MSEAAATLDRDEQMLSRLAELDLAACEKVHGKLMAAEDATEIADLGRTYQRLARSLRQTLALKSKLARDRLVLAREVRKDAGFEHDRQVRARKAQVRAAVEPTLWDEYERADYELKIADLDEGLDALADQDDFLATPAAVHIARLRADLGLPPEDAAADAAEGQSPEPALESSG